MRIAGNTMLLPNINKNQRRKERRYNRQQPESASSNPLLSHGAVGSRPWHQVRNLADDLADLICHAGDNRSRRKRHEPGQKSRLDEILTLSVLPNPQLPYDIESVLQLAPWFSC
jgi:hypothetical protein